MAAPAFTRRSRFFVPSPTPPARYARCPPLPGASFRPRFFAPSPTPIARFARHPHLHQALRAPPSPSRWLPFGPFITKFSILNKVINH